MINLDGSGDYGRHKLRIVMVDDSSLYSKKLIEGLTRLGPSCVLYGPLAILPGKSPKIMVPIGPETVRVWTQNLFPFQIFHRAARDKPDLVHIQFEFYGIHSYGPIYTSTGLPFLLLLLRLAGIKTLVTLHSILPSAGSQLSKLRDASPVPGRIPTILLTSFLIISYKLTGLLSTGIVVHAQAFKRRLVDQYRVSPSKIIVVPHGVEPYQSSQPKVITNERITNCILYFGVISPRKGIESLLSAFALLMKRREDCELFLAGSSPPYFHGYEMALKDQAARLGLGQRIHFLGEVDDPEAHVLFERARFVILPYSYDVSASGVLSWAIGHGVPVIVSENEYFKEELSNREFGLMVRPGKPEFLADAMEMLLRREDLCASLSEQARKTGLSRSWTVVAGKTLQFYERIISHTPSDLSSDNMRRGNEDDRLGNPRQT
jgi:glycosyltransferase involved in cell wall biosynthesis